MATDPMQWRKGPRPDPTVLDLIEEIQLAARKGQVRAIHVTVVNPMLETDSKQAGDLDPVKTNLLAAGLLRAAHQLLLNRNSE